jgi:regulator of nonsense transcripts 2
VLQAAAITEAKLKMSDIACGAHICCLFYQRYSEFSNYLMDNWQKYLLSKKDEKVIGSEAGRKIVVKCL